MSTEAQREFVYEQSRYAKNAQNTQKWADRALALLESTGAEQSTIDLVKAHFATYMETFHQPYVLPEPDKGIEGNPNGRMTIADVDASIEKRAIENEALPTRV